MGPDIWNSLAPDLYMYHSKLLSLAGFSARFKRDVTGDLLGLVLFWLICELECAYMYLRGTGGGMDTTAGPGFQCTFFSSLFSITPNLFSTRIYFSHI